VPRDVLYFWQINGTRNLVFWLGEKLLFLLQELDFESNIYICSMRYTLDFSTIAPHLYSKELYQFHSQGESKIISITTQMTNSRLRKPTLDSMAISITQHTYDPKQRFILRRYTVRISAQIPNFQNENFHFSQNLCRKLK
jgi:hypothetical protein